MATVTGFTAERMLAMEAATIVDGDVVGDNLILTKHDGSTVDAGSVRGPTGSPGITNAEMLQHLPAGIVADWIGTSAPTKWLGITGQTIVGGQTLYPDLWAVLPASMKSGANIVFPDSRGKVSVGYNSGDTDFDAIGEIGGAKTHTLTQAELPASPVTVNPPSTAVTGSTGTESAQHTHIEAHRVGSVQNGTGTTYSIPLAFPYGGTSDVTDVESTTHTHPAGTLAVDIAQFNSGNMGSGAAHSIVQPYITFMKIIKAA